MSKDEVRQRLIEHQSTSLWLSPAKSYRRSKLGGQPRLPAGTAWPRMPNGQALAFVAQIDLAEVRAAGGPDWLPASGDLCFFALTAGIDPYDGWRVIHLPQSSDEVMLAPPKVDVFGERFVEMEAHPSYPEPEWLDLRGRDFYEHLDLLSEGFSPGPNVGEGDHRVCGYPASIQDGGLAAKCELVARGTIDTLGELYNDPPAFAALNTEAINRWRLLLQVDADEALGMAWVSSGRIWYLIAEEDARVGDFSKMRFDIQFM